MKSDGITFHGLILGIVCALITIAICLAMSGCETVESEDGVRTTRFDSAAFNSAVKTGSDLYDRYNRSQPTYTAPVRQPVYNPYMGLYR